MLTVYPAQSIEDICNQTNASTTTNHTLNSTLMGQINLANSHNDLDLGYLLSAGAVSALYLFCSLVTFFGTKEMVDVINDKNTKFFRSLSTVFKHKSYVTLLITFLLSSLAIQVSFVEYI